MNSKNTAVITGASSGIGREVARRLRNTHNLVLTGRSKERLLETAGLLATSTVAIAPCEIRDCEAVAQLMCAYKPTLIIHCAGIIATCGLKDGTVKHAKEMVETNYLGTVNVLHASYNHVSAGNIGVISSISGLFPAPGGYCVYGASKAALNAYCESVRRELLERGISLTIGHFSFVQTPMLSAPAASVSEERKRLRRFKRFSAEHAARMMVKDTLMGRKESHLSFSHRLLSIFARSAPRTFGKIIRIAAGI